MRIWRVHELGEPQDVMRLEEVEPPAAGPGEVVIDVEAVGLNFPDVLLCRGGYQSKPAMPFTPGSEIAARVGEVGEGAQGVAVGDRVLLCRGGGLAEKLRARPEELFPLGDTIPAEKAAALPTNYGTTLFALHDRARLQPGESLLVTAAAGGTGNAAIQLGLAAGARVLAAAGGAEKCEFCLKLGADAAVDYRSEDLVERVRELTDGRGVDVVYDPVGGDVFDQARRVVAWDGRYLVIGFTSGRIPSAPANHVLLKNYSLVGVHYGAWLKRDPSAQRRSVAKLSELYEQGRIDPPLFENRTFPLEDAASLLTKLASRRTLGKVVVTFG